MQDETRRAAAPQLFHVVRSTEASIQSTAQSAARRRRVISASKAHGRDGDGDTGDDGNLIMKRNTRGRR